MLTPTLSSRAKREILLGPEISLPDKTRLAYAAAKRVGTRNDNCWPLAVSCKLLASQSGLSTLIIMAAIALLLVGAIILAPIVSRPPTNSTNPDSSPVPQGSGIDDQSISILYLGTGDIEIENLKNSPDFLGCLEQPDGAIRCELRSFFPSRPNLVIIKNGKLLFKRTITKPLVSGRLPSYGNLSSGLGAAGQVQKGSRFFGPTVQTYIFASKGVTLIANPNTGEVKEVQVYPSQSISDYLSTYGEDIRGYVPTISAL